MAAAAPLRLAGQGLTVATTAFDNPDPRGDTPPVSLHPAFPAAVALWFAALLGVGTMLLPVILLERAVEATRLAAVLPAAEPPLGFTARALIAVGAALLGAVLGVAIARRVARSHAPAGAARPSPAVRKPINAHDELGDEGLGSVAPPRRVRAVAQDRLLSDVLPHAPPPVEDAFAHSVASEPEDTLELSDLIADEVPELEQDDAPEPVPTFAEDLPMSDEPLAPFPTRAELERRRDDRRARPGKGPGGLERRLFLRRVEDEPLPFVAPSLARRTPDNENTVAEAPAVAHDIIEPAASAPEPPATPADLDAAPLKELGLVQLVQRLEASLDKRRAQVAATPAAPEVPPAAPAEFDAAPAEEAAQAMAEYFGKPLPQWSAEDEALAASFSLRPAAPTEEPDEGEPEPEGDYGSLLGLRSEAGAPDPARALPPQEPPRPFDRPAGEAAFARPTPGDADEALRRALATLQRMSGGN
jgi:hypothetical protein